MNIKEKEKEKKANKRLSKRKSANDTVELTQQQNLTNISNNNNNITASKNDSFDVENDSVFDSFDLNLMIENVHINYDDYKNKSILNNDPSVSYGDINNSNINKKYNYKSNYLNNNNNNYNSNNNSNTSITEGEEKEPYFLDRETMKRLSNSFEDNEDDDYNLKKLTEAISIKNRRSLNIEQDDEMLKNLKNYVPVATYYTKV
jgi:hypothetical protein